jgi:hypothetical protein
MLSPVPSESTPAVTADIPAPARSAVIGSPGRIGALVLVAIALAGATTLLAALTRFEYGLDQGIYGVVGDVMLAGGAPYKDAWDFKPPGVFFVYATARALFGEGMGAVRVFEALAWATLVGAFALLGRRFAGGVAPGLLAGALAVSSHVWLGFWHTAQPEAFGAVLLVWALWLASVDPEDATPARQRMHWALAGALYTAAAFMKPPLGGGFLVSLGFAVHAARRAGIGALVPIVSFGAGALGILLALGLYFGAKGALGDFYQALFVYTPEYTRLTYEGGDLASKCARSVSILFRRFSWLHPIGLALFLVLPRLATRERELALHVLGILLLLLFGIALQGQFFAYHYMAALPLLALLAGFGLWKLTTLGERFAIGSVAAALLVFVFANANGLKGPIPGGFVERVRTLDAGRAHNMPSRRVAAWVKTHTQPGDPIYIWGFQPMIYVLAERPPASRFVYNSPLRAAWYREQGREQLMAELEATPPVAFLVESGDPHPASTGNDLDSVAELARFPRLTAFLAAGYDEGTPIESFKIHLRREP